MESRSSEPSHDARFYKILWKPSWLALSPDEIFPKIKLMNPQGIFLSFCLLLTAGLLQADRMFQKHFSESKDLEHVVRRLETEIESEKLKAALVRGEVVDLKYELAARDPKYRSPASEQSIDTSRMVLAVAKEEFRERKWDKAIETLQSLIDRFPSSLLLDQAHFLLAESYYLSGAHERCLDVVHGMMELFPQSEYTGYIMLRMGQILAARKRVAEAEEVYNAVIDQFSNFSGVKEQAKLLLAQLPKDDEK